MNGGDVDSLNNAFYNGNNFQVAYGSNPAQPASDPSTWATSLARPQWTYDSGTGKIGYWGSLVRFDGLNGSINIQLEDEAFVEMPLTTDFFQADLNQLINGSDLNQTPAGGNHGTIEQWIATRLTEGGKGGQTTVLNLANTDAAYLNHYVNPAWGSEWGSLISNQVMELKQKVEVYGYGKIVGKWLQNRMINNQWGWNMEWNMQELLNTNQPKKLGEVLEYIEFKVLAGLLYVVSTHPADPKNDKDFSISVWGVHIADTMKLNYSSVELNGIVNGWKPEIMKSTKVKIYDAKLYSWFDGADGFEVAAQNSVIMNCFIQSADDSFKVAASGQKIIDNLVYQGNAGGALNMGVYGSVKLNISGATVSGLFVHRVAQPIDQYDERGALLVIRQTQKGASVQDVTVDRVFVPSLGGYQPNSSGLKGPNVIYRAWAFGIQPIGWFPGSGITDYTLVSDITILNSDIYTNPREESMIYGGGTKFDPTTYTNLYGKNAAGKIWNLSFYDVKATTAKEVNETMLRIWNSDTKYYGVWPNGLQKATQYGKPCDPVGWIGTAGKPDEMEDLTAPNADWPNPKDLIPGVKPDREVIDYGNYGIVGPAPGNLFNVPYRCTKRVRALGETDEVQIAVHALIV
jgi:hypothetical protein